MLPDYYVLSFSGGKDSTALGLEWLRLHKLNPIEYPLDEVVCCDTWMEFPSMYDHIDRVENLFLKSGVKFTRLRSQHSFEWYMFDYKPQRRNELLADKSGFSWPGPRARWCTARLKVDVIDKYIADLKKRYNLIQLVGIAADEQYRLERKNNQGDNRRHPLVEWGWDEKRCLQYCYDLGFDWGGLYEIFDRVSCWCCPLQSIGELRKLRKHFPDLWQKLLDMERRTWRNFKDRYSVEELEIRFTFEEERIERGLPIKGQEFFKELRKRLQTTNTN